jgi:hypothetical protein
MSRTGSELFARKRQWARPLRPGANGSWNAYNHYHADECQGADGWPSGVGENGRGLERAPALCGRTRQLVGRTRQPMGLTWLQAWLYK